MHYTHNCGERLPTIALAYVHLKLCQRDNRDELIGTRAPRQRSFRDGTYSSLRRVR